MTELATSPTRERQDVKRITHWIGGQAVPGESGRSGPVYNPATGEVVAGAVLKHARDFNLTRESVLAGLYDGLSGWAHSMMCRIALISKKTVVVGMELQQAGQML